MTIGSFSSTRRVEKEMATHSSVLAWRTPGTGEPGGLLSMGLHGVRHGWSDWAAAAAAEWLRDFPGSPVVKNPSFNAESSIPGQGTKIPHVMCPSKQTEVKRVIMSQLSFSTHFWMNLSKSLPFLHSSFLLYIADNCNSTLIGANPSLWGLHVLICIKDLEQMDA